MSPSDPPSYGCDRTIGDIASVLNGKFQSSCSPLIVVEFLGSLVNPALYCHWDLGIDLACVPVVVSNKSLYEQWNCGDTNPVCRLKINDTECACLDEYPKLIPILVLSCHFLAFLPFWISLCSTYTGHPK